MISVCTLALITPIYCQSQRQDDWNQHLQAKSRLFRHTCDSERSQEVRGAFIHKPQEKLHCLNNRKIQGENEKHRKEIRQVNLHRIFILWRHRSPLREWSPLYANGTLKPFSIATLCSWFQLQILSTIWLDMQLWFSRNFRVQIIW